MRVDNGEAKGNAQFERMRGRVLEIYPDLTIREVQHACNVISNGLRAWKGDIYEVRLSGAPFPNEDGYFHDFDVTAAGRQIFVRATVD
ncbi:hypothetical protein [Burkholderia ambifaria]|uniref:hypothetical protein n=1 Tax=Burkholderia ambifaria TaxID=152480 RepID=UPI00158D4F40|nr:hypothetical protein [Burkholderia ambifaria]